MSGLGVLGQTLKHISMLLNSFGKFICHVVACKWSSARELTFSATQIAAPPAGPSAEDIRKVVSEYKLKEEKKKKKTEEGKDDDKDKKDETKSPKTPETPPSVGVPTSNQRTHKKYALHRQIFESRKAEIRRKEQTVRAKEVSKGLSRVELADCRITTSPERLILRCVM